MAVIFVDGVTYGFLAFLDFLLLIVSIYQTVKLKMSAAQERGMRLQSKLLFHTIVIVILIGRIAQFISEPFVVIQDKQWSILIAFDFCCEMISSFLFALAYAILLVFWAEFTWIMQNSIFPNKAKFQKQVQFYLTICQVTTFLVITIAISVRVLVARFAPSSGQRYEDSISIFIGCIMVIEGVSFFVVGFRLFTTLETKPLNDYMASKRIEIMVVAVLCTLLFIMRAILAILPVQFEDLFEIKKDDDTADSEGDTVIFKMDIGKKNDSIPWWYVLLYYIVCEDIPIALMIWFHRRLPKKPQRLQRRQSSLYYHKSETVDEESPMIYDSEIEQSPIFDDDDDDHIQRHPDTRPHSHRERTTSSQDLQPSFNPQREFFSDQERWRKSGLEFS